MKSAIILGLMGVALAAPFRPEHHKPSGTGVFSHHPFPTGTRPHHHRPRPTGAVPALPSGTDGPAFPSGTDEAGFSGQPFGSTPTAEPVDARDLEISYNLAPRQDGEAKPSASAGEGHHHHSGHAHPTGTRPHKPHGTGEAFGTGKPHHHHSKKPHPTGQPEFTASAPAPTQSIPLPGP